MEAFYLTWEKFHCDFHEDGKAALSDQTLHFPPTPLYQEEFMQFYSELDQENMALEVEEPKGRHGHPFLAVASTYIK